MSCTLHTGSKLGRQARAETQARWYPSVPLALGSLLNRLAGTRPEELPFLVGSLCRAEREGGIC